MLSCQALLCFLFLLGAVAPLPHHTLSEQEREIPKEQGGEWQVVME